MKKVLFVCSSLDTGGAQKMLSNLVMSFPEEWEIDIVLNSDKNIQYPYKGEIISLQVNEPKNRQSLIYQTRIFFQRTRVLNHLKKRHEYLACISFLDSANIANIISSVHDCKTVITSVTHISMIKQQKVYKYIVFPIARMLYHKADKMIVQTPYMEKEMISFYKLPREMVQCIATGIDVERIQKIAKIPLSAEDCIVFRRDRTVITAGRLTRNKGQWHLIRAFSYVKKKVKDANLVIFGEGELREQLQSLIDRLQLSSSVTIRAFDEELDKFIANSAVFAFPSLYEGVPIALMEAMVCGTSCICTSFGAGASELMGYDQESNISSLLEAKYGLVSPSYRDEVDFESTELEPEEKVLAEGIERLLLDADYRSRYEEMAKQRGQSFDMKRIIKEWINVIQQ